MSNETLFYTQIISIVVFLIALFTLYRLLVDQKEATIQLLKEKVDWMQKQLDSATKESPDVLVDVLKKRADASDAELRRLSGGIEKLKEDERLAEVGLAEINLRLGAMIDAYNKIKEEQKIKKLKEESSGVMG